MTPTFHGQIAKGKLLIDKPDQLRAHLHTLEGKRVEVTVEKLTHNRSNQQNKYYWGCVVKTIAEHTGHDPEQVHELLKAMFSPKWHMRAVPIGFRRRAEISIPTSTARLDTTAFVEYTEKCRLWANEFLGLQIPEPGEVTA